MATYIYQLASNWMVTVWAMHWEKNHDANIMLYTIMLDITYPYLLSAGSHLLANSYHHIINIVRIILGFSTFLITYFT